MKKLFTLIGAILITGSVMAQKPSSDSPFSLEGNINYNSMEGISFTAPSVRLRYFFKDNMAGRVEIGMMNTSINDSTGTSMMNIGLGYEYHLDGTDKMSPYFGARVGFGSDTDAADVKTSSLAFGIIGGMDYYVRESIYVGLELGLGFGSTTVGDADAQTTFGNSMMSAVRMGWRF